MSSFTSTVKDEVINLGEKSRKCCSFSLLYGFLFCAVNENHKYYIKTTNVEIADSFIKLCDFLFKKKHMCFYKNGKISIDSSILRFSTIDEYKSNVFKCDDCIHYLNIFRSSNHQRCECLREKRLLQKRKHWKSFFVVFNIFTHN